MNIVFVCTGNTCRSPLAEGLMKKKIEEKGITSITVTSAGIAAFSGDPVSENSVKAAKKYGVDISQHRARQISPYMLDDSVFVCMTQSHIRSLSLAIEPQRLMLLGGGIPDPFGGDYEEYERCAEMINSALDCVLAEVFRRFARIEPMSEDHLQSIALLEQQCFSLPWSENSLREELSNENAHFLAAVFEQEVLGYIGVIEICGEAEITNIAVFEQYRHNGIAQMLLNAASSGALSRENESITLEVRVSNSAAIALYAKNGFKQVGIRHGFYEKPKEDALLMTKELKKEDNDENSCY